MASRRSEETSSGRKPEKKAGTKAGKKALKVKAGKKPAKKLAQAGGAAVVPHHGEGTTRELVILTGLSGSGKMSAAKAFEDLGYYSVDNLPLELIPSFADLVLSSAEITHALLVVDVREGSRLDRFPQILKQVRKVLPTRVVYLEASDDALVRRFSETRRPHPLSREETVVDSIRAERKRLEPVRNVADILLDTTKFNVHELRARINQQFERGHGGDHGLALSVMSFGFKNGVPSHADLVFDVRFLPNPHFVPKFRKLTGKDKRVAEYVMEFPQTQEFLNKATDMLTFLLPHYIQEGKSYLTVAIGCTGGQHRSVMIAEELRKRLAEAGYRAKAEHRDMPR